MSRSRSLTASLSRLLAEIRSPVYVLDGQRAIVYVNAALESWLQTPGEELLDLRCDYQTPAGAKRCEELAAALCPPPAALVGDVNAFRLTCPLADGTLSRRTARLLRLASDPLETGGVIVVVDAEESPEPQANTIAAAASDESHSMHEALQAYRRRAAGRFRLDRLVGQSPEITRVRRQVISAIRGQPRTVVVGPTGSGREHIARTIHYAGDEAAALPLLPLACPLMDAELMQTTITAFARRVGQSSTARPGALLLLEVDGLDEVAQAELSGFLNQPGFDLQILATARISPLAAAARGEFRADLAMALCTLIIELPPLAARPHDVPLLAQMILEQHNAAGAKQIGGFTSDALDVLAAYSWPRNIDELAEAVRHAHAAAAGPLVTVADLPDVFRLAESAAAVAPRNDEPIMLDEFLVQIERELLERALRRAKGNKTKAAELLGISRARLHRRLEEMQVEE
jgi:DNA-binding NtrC family response regulator